MNIAENKIKLLADLSKEDSASSDEIIKKFDELYSVIKLGFIPKLEMSTFPNKSKIVSFIESYLEWIEPVINFKSIIEKSLITVIGSDYGTCYNILNNILEGHNSELYAMNSNIPSIIVNNKNDTVKLLNLLNNEVILSKEDYKVTTRELYKDKIDIREFIKVFEFSDTLLLNNVSIGYLPDYALRTTPYYNTIQKYSNALYLFADDKNNWKYNIKHLNQINFAKDICIFAENDYKNNIYDYIKQFDKVLDRITVYDINDLQEVCKRYDYNINNINITYKLLSILNKVELYYVNKIKKFTFRLELINNDLIKMEDKDTENSIRKIKDDIIQSLSNEESSYNEFLSEKNVLLQKAEALDDVIMNIYSKKCDADISTYLEDVLIEVTLQMIEKEDFKSANEFINKLESRKFQYSFILGMLLNMKMKSSIHYTKFNKLKSIDDNHFLVCKAKIAFREKIDLSDEKAGEYFLKIPRRYIYENYEYYVAGRYFEKHNLKRSIKLYYDALELGSIEAGNRLFKLSKLHDEIDVDYLAQNMVAEANYEVGLSAVNNNRYAKGITNIKIAAALGNMQAVRYLADLEYNKIIRNYKYKNESSTFNSECEKLLQLYFHLLDINKKDESIIENIGFIYNAIGDYRKALDFLLKCKSQYAVYTSGTIYQYGKGTVPQDIYEAKKLFKRASNLGHKKAQVEYQKVCGWIEANEYKQKEKSSNNYSNSSSYTYESSSGGLCFITTATCVALNKQDNCEELLAFKHYRDTTLINESNGPSIIREYYRIAPRIVEAIEQEVNSVDVYKKIWEKFIIVGYRYLLQDNMDKAKQTYINMVVYLCKRYNVELKYSIEI